MTDTRNPHVPAPRLAASSAALPDQVASAWPAADMPWLEERLASPDAVLEDVGQQLPRLRQASLEAERLGFVLVPELTLPDVVSLAAWQTMPIRNQLDRGTCYAFATIAAMEAAYKRTYGLELDLSEQYAFHINKANELYPGFESMPAVMHENNSSLWGFQGSSDLVAKLARCAVPLEADAPYLDNTAMEQLGATYGVIDVATDGQSQESMDGLEFDESHVPLRARQSAKYRVGSYAALPWQPTPEQVQAVLAAGHEVIADIPGHCVLIVGYDAPHRQWLVKNSWGETSFVRWSFDDPNTRILGGTYITSVLSPAEPRSVEAAWLGRWQMDHDGWRGELVLRRTTDHRSSAGAPTKLGDYYRDGSRYDVNGTLEDGGRQLHCWIADTTDRVPAGQQRGQEFRIWIFSWEPSRAAGVTTWSGQPFGVSLSRDLLPGTPSRGFDASSWLGAWAMDHDGWQGSLQVTSATPFAATYTTQGGEILPVSGGPLAGRPYEVELTIPFSADNHQRFRLLGHTWEKDVLSGTTIWSGMTFGVQGHRVG